MRVTVLLYFLPILAIAQGGQPIGKTTVKAANHLTAFAMAEGTPVLSIDKIEAYLEKLSSKKTSFKNEGLFLNHVFTKTHQRFLKRFSETAKFSDLLKDGTYNCLTGTTLYALILDHLGIKYQIIETNYHIFLLAESSGGQVLIEATDPINGFVTNADEIEKRIQRYRQNSPQVASSDKTYYRFTVNLFNPINLSEMLGLLHYNLAVEAYNHRDLQSSITHLDHAIDLYQSPRLEEFSMIVLLTVMESKLEPSVKEKFLRKIQAIRSYKMNIVASTKSF